MNPYSLYAPFKIVDLFKDREVYIYEHLYVYLYRYIHININVYTCISTYTVQL
uniref:Uncharacterized protein n=1 Tax=Anguilla anguilla TaxID=7936 RepID=A0A0E9TAZ8_ANGAN